MKRLCKDIDITDRDLISKATYKCIKNKYKRNDVLELFSSISGLYKNQIHVIYTRYGRKAMKPFVEILIDVIRNELLNRNISFPPIWYKDKIDASSGKVRHIGIQNIKQQIYDYIAVEGLKPLFKRIGRHQYASIKGRGQVAGTRTIRRWLRNKSITYYVKLDIKKCYPSIQHDKLFEFLEKHIKNEMLMWLIKELIKTFKNGLSIGSYLSQYLCNLFMSQIYHYIGHLHKIRKHKNGKNELIKLVYHQLFYMDDIYICGMSAKNMNKSVKEIIKFCGQISLTVKNDWHVKKLSLDNNDKSNFVDMMGYRIYRDHVTIRRRVFKRIRRVYMKVYKKWKTHKYILVIYARKCISYYGMIKNSDSFNLMKKYHVKDIVKISKRVVKNYDQGKVYERTASCFC